MKPKLILKETLSDIVYHMTYINSVYEILKSDSFALTAQMGTPSDSIFSDSLYYLSVATSKWGGYANHFNPENVATLVLDGRKLSQRYKGIPVDYWGYDFRKRAIDPDNTGGYNPQSFHSNDEQEQRVLSDKPFLPKASSYIKEIHLCLGNNKLPYTPENNDAFFETFFNHKLLQPVKEIKRQGELHEIPVYVYLDYSAFKILDKRKAYYRAGGISYAFIKAILKLYYGKPMNKDEISYSRDIVRPIDEYLYNKNAGRNPASGPAVRDFMSRLNSDIHNFRKDLTDRKIVDSLMEVYRKNKISKIWEILGVLHSVLEKRHGKEWTNAPYILPYYTREEWN